MPKVIFKPVLHKAEFGQYLHFWEIVTL